jgi:hypothetical protein
LNICKIFVYNNKLLHTLNDILFDGCCLFYFASYIFCTRKDNVISKYAPRNLVMFVHYFGMCMYLSESDIIVTCIPVSVNGIAVYNYEVYIHVT